MATQLSGALLGLTFAVTLAACGEDYPVEANEVAFSKFVLNRPPDRLICNWSASPDTPSAVIGVASGDGNDRCDHPIIPQLLGELDPESTLIGPIDPATLAVDAPPRAVDASLHTPLEAYALSWFESDDTDPKVRVAAPFNEAPPSGWHSCRPSCAVAFSYNGVAVRLFWNPEVHGADVVAMTRRAHAFLDAHTTSTDRA